MADLQGKVIVISGAAHSVGPALVEHLQGKAKLVLHDREDADWTTLGNVAEDSVRVVKGNIEEAGQVQRLLKEALDAFGAVDGLVINHNKHVKPGAEEDSLDTFDFLLAYNVRAVVELVSAFETALIQSKGSVVTLVPATTSRPLDYRHFQAVTGGAVVQHARHWAQKLGPHGVRLNTLAVGFVDQPQAAPITLLGRPAQGAELASAMEFLLSKKASYVTAAHLLVDGGYCSAVTPVGQPMDE